MFSVQYEELKNKNFIHLKFPFPYYMGYNSTSEKPFHLTRMRYLNEDRQSMHIWLFSTRNKEVDCLPSAIVE